MRLDSLLHQGLAALRAQGARTLVLEAQAVASVHGESGQVEAVTRLPRVRAAKRVEHPAPLALGVILDPVPVDAVGPRRHMVEIR